VCLLLWGVNLISSGLNKAFGTSLRKTIANSTNNPVKAVIVGAAVAIGMQSSIATCMIVCSFAVRNIISLSSSIAVMLGADVGTTIAAQVMSLDLTWLMPVLITGGYIITKTLRASMHKHLGSFFVGIGLVLLALTHITNTAEHLKNSEILQLMLVPLQQQPIMAIAFSLILTWVVHSSLGMVLLYTSFVNSGTMPIDIAFYMVLGANLGGAIAPVVITMRENPLGRRIPMANLLVKILGVLFILPFMSTMIIPNMANIPGMSGARAIVNFHTIFNVILALACLPFISIITDLMRKFIPEPVRLKDDSLPKFLDYKLLNTPPAALACAARETLRMCDVIEEMFDDTLHVLHSNDYEVMQRVCEKERMIDSLYMSIKDYLAKIDSDVMAEEDIFKYTQILTFATNLEYIGDVMDRSLMKLAMKKISSQDSFSRQGYAEIADIHAKVKDNMKIAQNLLFNNDYRLAEDLILKKGQIKEAEILGMDSHLKRFRSGIAETRATSSIHMDVLRDFVRINSYLSMIAYDIVKKHKERQALVNKEIESK